MSMFYASTASEALALLTALGDPAATKAVLDDLAARESALAAGRAEVDKRNDTLNALAADLSTRESALANAKSTFETARQVASQDIASRGADLNASIAAFQADKVAAQASASVAAEALRNREIAVSALDSTLKEREAAVQAREDSIAPREAVADARAAEAQATIDKLKAAFP